MGREEPRSAAVRKADTLARLGEYQLDVWVASASSSGNGYLVPLSLAWIEERVVLALDKASRTARNIIEHRTARLGIGPTRDVVLIDAVLEQVVDVDAAPPAIAEGYAGQADWDPRDSPDGYAYLVLRPDRVQAWRETNELVGRTLMRNGSWLV